MKPIERKMIFFEKKFNKKFRSTFSTVLKIKSLDKRNKQTRRGRINRKVTVKQTILTRYSSNVPLSMPPVSYLIAEVSLKKTSSFILNIFAKYPPSRILQSFFHLRVFSKIDSSAKDYQWSCRENGLTALQKLLHLPKAFFLLSKRVFP